MADDIPITEGDGAASIVYADDIGTNVKAQIVKVTIGADGAAGALLLDDVGVSAAGVQRVTTTSDQSDAIKVSGTIQTAAYAAGDLIGGKLTVAGAARLSGAGGIITGVSVALQSTAATWAANDLEAFIFFADPTNTTFTENAALDIAVLDQGALIGAALLDEFADGGSTSVLQVTNLNMAYACSSGTSLYACFAYRGAGVTPDSTTGEVFFHVIKD